MTASLLVVRPVFGHDDNQEGAMEAFKVGHQQVVSLVKKKAKSERIQKEVDKLLDYDWLAQTALGGLVRGQRRCEPRCDEFEALLTRLIRENYLKRIELSDRGKLEYSGEERRPRASKVTTKVRYTKNGHPQVIEIAYIMHKVGDTWQVRDIVTDGVSLARNYKYEFNKILREQGIDGLIARLQSKLDDLAKNQ